MSENQINKPTLFFKYITITFCFFNKLLTRPHLRWKSKSHHQCVINISSDYWSIFSCYSPQMNNFDRSSCWKHTGGCPLPFCLVCFVSLNESTCETSKNVSLFHFRSSLRSWYNQILTFQISKRHDVIKCPSINHKTHFNE